MICNDAWVAVREVFGNVGEDDLVVCCGGEFYVGQFCCGVKECGDEDYVVGDCERWDELCDVSLDEGVEDISLSGSEWCCEGNVC